MSIFRRILLICIMLSAASMANATAIQVCSGSISSAPGAPGMTSNCSLGALSLQANSQYTADLLITPSNGSIGPHVWNMSIFDAGTNSVLGFQLDQWVGDSPVTLSLPFTTLTDTTTINALIAGWNFASGSAQYSLIVTAVPEASVWIMMLGGAGLISLMLRNRKTKDARLFAS